MRAGRPRSQGFVATWGPGVPPAYSAAFFSWDRGRPARILRILSHLGTRRPARMFRRIWAGKLAASLAPVLRRP
jgi:hypothetical protein